jgi:hypothetical protein
VCGGSGLYNLFSSNYTMATAIDAACPACGMMLERGWALFNHRRHSCRINVILNPPTVDVDEEFFDDLEGSDGYSGNEDIVDVLGSSSEEEGDVMTERSTMAYLSMLDHNGTVEYEHVLQYTTWGNYECTTSMKEVLRFLRAVYCGTGVSRRQAQELLDYQHSMGGNAFMLPTKVEKCWLRVEEVTVHTVRTSRNSTF